MRLYVLERESDDVDKITRFLLSQVDVIGATVWVQKGRVLARVTLVSDSSCEEHELLEACERELGPTCVPAMIMLERALRPAA